MRGRGSSDGGVAEVVERGGFLARFSDPEGGVDVVWSEFDPRRRAQLQYQKSRHHPAEVQDVEVRSGIGKLRGDHARSRLLPRGRLSTLPHLVLQSGQKYVSVFCCFYIDDARFI